MADPLIDGKWGPPYVLSHDTWQTPRQMEDGGCPTSDYMSHSALTLWIKAVYWHVILLRRYFSTFAAAALFWLIWASTAFSQTEETGAFRSDRINALVLIVVFSVVILLYTRWAKEGKPLFIRKIAGLDAVEEAVGRATEMGRPVLFIPGIQELDEISTIAGVSILGRVARIVAQYDTPIFVPLRYPLVLAASEEVVQQAYVEMGRADSYQKDSVRYVAGEQFAFAATVNGYMMRERPAACLYMGYFAAESLLLAETGNAAGSIQIAGTNMPEQLPFFIASCDYTLMGEELYAASAYLSHEPVMLGGLKGQDLMKLLIIVAIILGVILVSFGSGVWYTEMFKQV